MKKKLRLLSFVLAIVMILMSAAFTVSAVQAENITESLLEPLEVLAYDNLLRSDMSIYKSNAADNLFPFYDLNSEIVINQAEEHGEY